MKNEYKKFPLVFLIFGVFIIVLISGVSMKKYVKTKEEASAKQISAQKNSDSIKEKEKDKLFFNKPENMPKKTSIKVYKKRRVLELYAEDKLIGRFKIGLGKVPEGDKEKEGDNKTPEGSYYICYRNGNTKYYYFMGISYPNIKDAKRGLEQGVIDKVTYNRINKAIEEEKQPPWNTILGGAIGLQGGGNNNDYSYGSIALTNEDINILKQYVPNKTSVEIYK
jgi:hypothetical protein